MKKENIGKFVFSIIICQLAGVLGSVFTSPSVKGWYTTIQKPFFNPPNWVFAPVWTLLFLLMGISLYFVIIKKRDKNVKIGITLFGIQLGLNVIWSILFFGFKSPLYGLIEIIFLWIVILITIIQFFRIDKRASYLLIPYLLWVTFAAFLNFSIYILNA
jgi:benzodiazapine receptor